MFLIDDLLLRGLGVSIPVFDLFWSFEQLYKFAFKERYNPDKIKSNIIENRLLFEFGEITRDEYEEKNHALMHDLRLAERADEMGFPGRIDLLAG